MDPAALVFYPLLAVLIISWGTWTIELASAPRSRSLGRELARATMLAVVPGLGAMWLAVSSRGLRELETVGAGSLLVPWELAISASAATVVLLAALAVRLRGQPPAETEDDPLLPSDHLFVPWSTGALIVVATGIVVLGLSNGWWLEGACLGVAFTVPVLFGQRGVYWLLGRRRSPPSRRLLLLLTVGPLLAVAVPVLGLSVYSAQPRVVAHRLLGRPLPERATDVTTEERRRFDFFESRWHCSFRLSPSDLDAFATAAGFKPSEPLHYTRFGDRRQEGLYESEELWIDGATGRVHYRWRRAGGW